MRVQMRALLFLAVLTTGITAAMERVEKAVATALNLTGASQNALPLLAGSCKPLCHLPQSSGRAHLLAVSDVCRAGLKRGNDIHT